MLEHRHRSGSFGCSRPVLGSRLLHGSELRVCGSQRVKRRRGEKSRARSVKPAYGTESPRIRRAGLFELALAAFTNSLHDVGRRVLDVSWNPIPSPTVDAPGSPTKTAHHDGIARRTVGHRIGNRDLPFLSMGALFQQEVHRQDEIILRPLNDRHTKQSVNHVTGAFIFQDPLATRRENASVRRIVQVSQRLRHDIEYAKAVRSGAL